MRQRKGLLLPPNILRNPLRVVKRMSKHPEPRKPVRLLARTMLNLSTNAYRFCYLKGLFRQRGCPGTSIK